MKKGLCPFELLIGALALGAVFMFGWLVAMGLRDAWEAFT